MQEDLINGITEEEAAQRLGFKHKDRLKKLRLAGMVNRDKYRFWQGYIYSKDIAPEDLSGRRRGQHSHEERSEGADRVC